MSDAPDSIYPTTGRVIVEGGTLVLTGQERGVPYRHVLPPAAIFTLFADLAAALPQIIKEQP